MRIQPDASENPCYQSNRSDQSKRPTPWLDVLGMIILRRRNWERASKRSHTRDRGSCFLGRPLTNFRDEAVSASWKSLVVLRSDSRVAQCFPQLVDSRVEAVSAVNQGSAGPKALLQLIASHKCARSCEQHFQNVKRLPGKPHHRPLPVDLLRTKIDLERPKKHHRF